MQVVEGNPMPLDSEALRELIAIVDGNNRVAQDGHARHTRQFQEVEARQTQFEARLHAAEISLGVLNELRKQPVQASSIQFSWTMMVATVIFCVTVVTSAVMVLSNLDTVQKTLQSVTQMQKLNQIDINEVKVGLARLQGLRVTPRTEEDK